MVENGTDDKAGGYIKAYRKFQKNPIWNDPDPFDKRSAWLDMLYEARWHPTPAVTIIGGHIVEVRRGEVAYSCKTWGLRWKWDHERVRRWFKTLEKLGQIKLLRNTKTTHLIICNYDLYQELCVDDALLDDYETTMSRVRSAYEVRTTEEREERKEGEEVNGASSPDMLKMFQNSHPSCRKIGEIPFYASIAACRSSTTMPDVVESIKVFSRHMAGAELKYPLREFEKYLRKSYRIQVERELRKKKKAAAQVKNIDTTKPPNQYKGARKK